MEVTKSEWNGFERLDFLFEERAAIVVLPKIFCFFGTVVTDYFV